MDFLRGHSLIKTVQITI